MSATLSLAFLEGKVIRGTSTPWRLLFLADETGEDLGTPGPCRASLWWVRAEPQEGSKRACTPPQQASGVWGEREQRNISSCIFCLTRCFTICVLSSLT